MFHVPATMIEPQLPEIEEELMRWKVGDAMLDARSRAQRHSIVRSRSGMPSGASRAVDTIRLSVAPDQLAITSFMALRLPTSLHEKQVTNFEVRRLMQRAKGRRLVVSAESESASGPEPNSGVVAGSGAEGSARGARVASSTADGHRGGSGDAANDERDGADSAEPPSATSHVLSGMDAQVLQRKGAELTFMIRDAARERAVKMPLPDRQEGRSAAAAAVDGRKDIQRWYHRLGLEHVVPQAASTATTNRLSSVTSSSFFF